MESEIGFAPEGARLESFEAERFRAKVTKVVEVGAAAAVLGGIGWYYLSSHK